MTSKTGAIILATAALLATPALAQSNGQKAGGNANAPGALMTTCPTQQDGHKSASQGSATQAKPANPTTRSSTGINGATTCPDGTVPPTGTTSANGGAGA